MMPNMTAMASLLPMSLETKMIPIPIMALKAKFQLTMKTLKETIMIVVSGMPKVPTVKETNIILNRRTIGKIPMV